MLSRQPLRALRDCGALSALPSSVACTQVAGRECSGNAAPPLYPTHVRISAPQRALLALGAAVGALLRPERADLVAACGEASGRAALERMRRRMAADPDGAVVLRERPRITDETLAACWALPAGTFGNAYAQFMGVRHFSPRDRPPVRFVDDEELAYVAVRYREVHDLWHVLFGCDTTVAGEVALKAVEAVQTGLPSAALAALFGPLRLSRPRRAELARTQLPWALRAGAVATDLLCLRYEQHWAEPLPLLRARWRIATAPPFADAGRRNTGASSKIQARE